MIHLEGDRIAARRGDLTDEAIVAEAARHASDLYISVPPAIDNAVSVIPNCMAKAERDGDTIVEETTGRLLAEALGCIPADLGRNPPELPFSRESTYETLRAKQRRRLLRLIHDLAEKHRKSRKRRNRHKPRSDR
jgi:hypothetical protein